MPSLYDEILQMGGFNKSASTEGEDPVSAVKEALDSFSDEDLVRLANELSGLANGGMGDLEAMTLQEPSFLHAAGNQITDEAKLEAIEAADVQQHKTHDELESIAPTDKEPIVDGVGGEGDATDVDGGSGKRASESLLEILKEGAAIEELIETRAYELAEAMIKEAEDMDNARAIITAVSDHLGKVGPEAHEFCEKAMNHAKTLAAQTNSAVADAAHAIASEIAPAMVHAPMAMGKAASEGDELDSISDLEALERLASYTTAMEAEYEKLAEAAVAAAQNVLLEAGQKQGLGDNHLYEFVQRGMDQVRTHAAQTGKSIPEAAMDVISGSAAGDVTAQPGYDGGIAPSPAVAGVAVKAPINSNVTQNPDKLFAQMTGDPQAVAEAAPAAPAAVVAPAAAPAQAQEKKANEDLKSLIKEALLSKLAQ